MSVVFHNTKKGLTLNCFFESVIVTFISLWKLKFLAYMLNVTERFVMRIISYANIVYFLFLFNYCSWQWMPFIESATPLGVGRSAGKVKDNYSGSQ